MKKTLLAIASVTLLLSFTGCKTTEVKGSDFVGKEAKVDTPRRKIVDYKSNIYGEPIPQWVIECVQGNTAKLPKLMPNLEKKKVFIASKRGNDLDFLTTWVNSVGIDKKISNIFETVIATSTSTSQEGQSDGKSTSLNQEIKQMTESLSSVRLSGIEQVADFWVEVEEYDKGKVVDKFYEYYVVAAMDQKAFDKQFERAMEGITDVTTESESLKEILRERIGGEKPVSTEDKYYEIFF